MRLWHESLIQSLPRQQLLGQHREVAALRGNGWGKPHSVVNYVFRHAYADLFRYHCLIMLEMKRRGYRVDALWLNQSYRGKCVGYDHNDFTFGTGKRYVEHDAAYLAECLANLAEKGITVDFKEQLS